MSATKQTSDLVLVSQRHHVGARAPVRGRPGRERKSHPRMTLSSVPSMALEMAVSALMNNRTVVSETKGDKALVSYQYPTELVAAMRGLFGSDRTYDFMMVSSATYASTGGGVVLNTLNWSPAITTYSEWSALAALFDEVKLLDVALSWTTAYGPTSSAIVAQIALAPDPISTSSGTFTQVNRLAESIEFNVATGLNDRGSSTLKKSHKIPSDRPYANTATPAVTSPPAGCLGQWVFSSNIVITPSINYAFLVNRAVVRLRNRA